MGSYRMIAGRMYDLGDETRTLDRRPERIAELEDEAKALTEELDRERKLREYAALGVILDDLKQVAENMRALKIDPRGAHSAAIDNAAGRYSEDRERLARALGLGEQEEKSA